MDVVEGGTDRAKAWKRLTVIGESERHFNEVEHNYRRLASTVLLASFAGMGSVIDLNRTNEIERRRVERSGEALDAPVDRLVGHVDLSLELAEARVEPEKRVDREQPLSERNLRVREIRARLVVERAVAILTELPLERPIAAVSDRQVRTAAGTGHTITPADLLQQVCCDRFRPKHLERNHS